MSGTTPLSRIILKSLIYMGSIRSNEDFKCSFNRSSLPGDLLFFSVLTAWLISSTVTDELILHCGVIVVVYVRYRVINFDSIHISEIFI